MTREEVREEYKESEGSPETRGRIREAQRALARGRMMQEVPKADVVVTNPTHFAVALRYDEKTQAARRSWSPRAPSCSPRSIREIAAENGVPIVEAPPLARALYQAASNSAAKCRPRCTSTVAQVLTYVYQLRAARERGAAPPPPPTAQSDGQPTHGRPTTMADATTSRDRPPDALGHRRAASA